MHSLVAFLAVCLLCSLSAGALAQTPCCMPMAWTAEHSSSLLIAEGISNSSSSTGILYRDSKMKRIAYNVTTLMYESAGKKTQVFRHQKVNKKKTKIFLYPKKQKKQNKTERGVLVPMQYYVIALFEKGLVALIQDGNCQLVKANTNISALFQQDCYGPQYDTPFIATVTLGLGKLRASVARNTVSNPGHFTLITDSTVPHTHPSECGKLADHVTVLNGNSVPIIVLRQNFGTSRRGLLMTLYSIFRATAIPARGRARPGWPTPIHSSVCC